MAFTARLPEKLQADAQAHAAELGISLNALLAVALSDYLARPHRRTRLSEPQSNPPAPSRQASMPAPSAATPATVVQPLPTGATGSVRPPKSRSDPCPCGAVDRDGHRLKFKHCHGKP